MAKVKLSPVELLERFPLNEKRIATIRANHLAGRHDWPRPFCPLCMGTTSATPIKPPERQSLYPEREVAFCGRCHCWHWLPGRCFAEDAAFLDATLGPRSRMKAIAEVGLTARTKGELDTAERSRHRGQNP